MDTDFESILCTTPEQSKTVQLILFKQGSKWLSGCIKPMYLDTRREEFPYALSRRRGARRFWIESRYKYTITAQEFIFLNHHILKE